MRLTKIQTHRLRRFFAQIQDESKQRGASSEGVTSASGPKKRKQAILSLGRSGQLQVLRNESASPEKEPWEKYLLPNPHTDRLKFYNSIVQQIYESSFVSKQAGFKQYLLKQQQMCWQLNTKIKALSDKETNLLKNEKWGVCQNINKFISGVDGCKGSDDVAKCESCLTTVNDAFNSAADLLSFIDNKRKNLFTEEHNPKPFASDELKYFQEAQERVKAIYVELQKASNTLTTTLMSLERKLARNMEVVVASMNEGNGNGDGKGSSSGEDSDESDEEAVQEPVEKAAEESAREALGGQDSESVSPE
ncbi:hypothetical protein ACROYT_G040851 [Oculina patagonica]